MIGSIVSVLDYRLRKKFSGNPKKFKLKDVIDFSNWLLALTSITSLSILLLASHRLS